MTISSSQSIATLLGSGSVSTWDFSFVPDAASYVYVTYTNASGTATPLSPTQYTITINPPATGQLWSNSFTIEYPLTGSPIASGTSLTVQRILPLQQLTSLSNQGNFYPAAVEAALDTLEMQIQQVSARTGAYRGVWVTGTVYNFGDIVQDGVNGAYTNNIYVAAQGNTSGVWATDLAAGDWVLSISVATLQPPGSFLPLTGGTVSGNLAVSGTLGVTGATTLSSTLAVTGHTTFEGVTSTGATGTGNIMYSASPTMTGTPVVPTASPGTATTQAASTQFVSSAVEVNGFRLTLTTGVPVTTSNVTGATTLYCTPYKSNRIALYSGSAWSVLISAQFSLALGTLTSGLPYDVFCYNNSGTPTLELAAWTNGTTRATALIYQDGILVKSGATTRRYLGTFYTTSTTTTEDSLANRYLWNYYNRIRRPMSRQESTASWTYSSATVRQANGNAANQLNFVIGINEDCVGATLDGIIVVSSGSLISLSLGIGLNSTTVISSDGGQAVVGTSPNSAASVAYVGTPAIGVNYLAWLEASNAGGGTQTWYASYSGGVPFAGLAGDVWA